MIYTTFRYDVYNTSLRRVNRPERVKLDLTESPPADTPNESKSDSCRPHLCVMLKTWHSRDTACRQRPNIKQKGRKEKTWNLKNPGSDTVYGNEQSMESRPFPGIGSSVLLGIDSTNNLRSYQQCELHLVTTLFRWYHRFSLSLSNESLSYWNSGSWYRSHLQDVILSILKINPAHPPFCYTFKPVENNSTHLIDMLTIYGHLHVFAVLRSLLQFVCSLKISSHSDFNSLHN